MGFERGNGRIGDKTDLACGVVSGAQVSGAACGLSQRTLQFFTS